MQSVRSFVLALAGVSLCLQPVHVDAAPADFAGAVVHYEPGAGVSPRFTHPEAALGAPSAVNPFGEAVDPFNPPYGTNQIVSIGAGGSLVVAFATPILNHPLNPHGLDFVIHGNAGFIITNEFDPVNFAWIGEPATDGSLFGVNDGETRVSVSRDGRTFYVLDPERAPTVDGPWPTDGAGGVGGVPLPGLTPDDFAGATLGDMRRLYAGAAGGTAYDLAWAVDEAGRSVVLPAVNFVRIDVLSGRSEVDALAVVRRVPVAGGWRRR